MGYRQPGKGNELRHLLFGGIGIMTALLCGAACAHNAGVHSKLVYPGKDGKLVYKPYTDRGDTIPDFSHCGYGSGGVAIPDVPVKVTLPPEAGQKDDLPRIQAALPMRRPRTVSPALSPCRAATVNCRAPTGT
jgi:hypothetical protein